MAQRRWQVTASLDEPLHKMELRNRYALRRVQLVGELSMPQGELQNLARRICDATGGTAEGLGEVCQSYPATVAVFLVFAAVYEYHSDTANYWDGVWRLLGLRGTSNRQRMLGKTFIRFLLRVGLKEFPHSPRRYVDPILLHATIPQKCLPSFLESVVAVCAENPEVSPADLAGLHAPVEHFLEHGGAVARDFVERCVQAYHLLKTGESSLDRLGLSEYVVEALKDWFADRKAAGKHRPGARLVLDPYEMGLVIELPANDLDPFNLPDASINGLKVIPNWVRRESGAVLRLGVPAPAEEYSATVGDHRYVVRGVAEGEPLYFQAGRGRRLPGGRLPAGELWVVAPQGFSPLAVGAAQSSPVIGELPPLPGRWADRTCMAISTEGASLIRWVDRAGKTRKELSRAIEEHEATSLTLLGDKWEPPLVCEGGECVFLGKAPILRVPIDPASEDHLDDWQLWVTSGTAGDRPFLHLSLDNLLVQEQGSGLQIPLSEEFTHRAAQPAGPSRHEVDESGRATDEQGEETTAALGGVPQDYIGTVHIRLLGPLGRDSGITFKLLSGVSIAAPSLTQLCVDNQGFVVAYSARLSLPPELQVAAQGGTLSQDGSVVTLLAGQYAAEVQLAFSKDGRLATSVGLRTQPFAWAVVTPAKGTPDWRAGTREIKVARPEDLLAQDLLLRSYLSADLRHELSLWADGQEVQRRALTLSSGDGPRRARVPLAQYADTVRQYEGAELELVLTIPALGWRVVLCQITYDWRVVDLRVELLREGDRYRLLARWQEDCPPRMPRTLILEDVWRGGEVELPIPEGALGGSWYLAEDQLPFGQYRLGFRARSGWSSRSRRPSCVSPMTVLDVEPWRWSELVQQVDEIQDWITAASAYAAGALNTLPPLTRSNWRSEDLAALGRLTTRLLGQGALEDIVDKASLSLEERILAATIADLHGGDVRSSSLALRLPHQLTAAGAPALGELGQAWPVLSFLAGRGPAPAIECDDLRYAWGRFFSLQNPTKQTSDLEGIPIHPAIPAVLLGNWLARPSSWSELRRQSSLLSDALEVLDPQWLEKLSIVAAAKLNGAGLRSGWSAIREVFRRGGGHSLTLTARLAYCVAVLSLLQRSTAWACELRQAYIKQRCYELEPLCLVCPPLYDYYLVLSELVIAAESTPAGSWPED